MSDSKSTATIPIPHTERNYTSSAGKHYVLPSDDVERDRLVRQHQLLKSFFDGQLILPRLDVRRGGNILDSGTGTGIWILDAAQILPSSFTLHGIDIEPGLFPTSLDQPARDNIHFSVNTVTNLPEEWSSTFLLVHQRLLIGALQLEKWRIALREIYRVLEPSGWAQLAETGSWKGGIFTEEHKRLMQSLFVHRNLLWDCAVHLPLMLEEAGFVNISVEKREIPIGTWAGSKGIEGRNNFIGVFRGMKTPILNGGGFGMSSEAEFDALMDNLQKEWDNTPGSEVDFYCICAQKPGPSS